MSARFRRRASQPGRGSGARISEDSAVPTESSRCHLAPRLVRPVGRLSGDAPRDDRVRHRPHNQGSCRLRRSRGHPGLSNPLGRARGRPYNAAASRDRAEGASCPNRVGDCPGRATAPRRDRPACYLPRPLPTDARCVPPRGRTVQGRVVRGWAGQGRSVASPAWSCAAHASGAEGMW